MSKKKTNRGRPTKFKKEYIEQVYKLTLLGFIDQDLAEFWGVSKSTINEWKVKYPEFSDSITRGKEFADTQVVDSLFNRAKGYTMKKVEYETVQGDDGQIEQKVKKIVTTDVPPDTQAIQFWLKNRQPRIWRDKKELEIESESPIILINDIKAADTKEDTDEEAN